MQHDDPFYIQVFLAVLSGQVAQGRDRSAQYLWVEAQRITDLMYREHVEENKEHVAVEVDAETTW